MDWLSPLNRIEIHKAVKKGATKVTLDRGRVFLLDYEIRPGEVYIKPEYGLVPQGYFNVKRIKDVEWLATTQ